MVKERIVLGHHISEKGIEIDRAKVKVIERLPTPISVKGVRSFLGHADFYLGVRFKVNGQRIKIYLGTLKRRMK